MALHLRHTYTTGSIVLLLLLTLSFLILPVSSRENVSVFTPAPDLNITNITAGPDGHSGDFVAGPTPVSILHIELNQSTLPGPRDMGYGPSVIDLSIAPQILAVIFTIILIGLGIWIVLKRRSEKN